MRVIAGKARRLNLVTPEGMDTRPTTDRIKETLFNMINNQLPGAVFVDLFAGSGAIGIEALSRGASKCYFAENAEKALKCIEKNLAFTKLENQAIVYRSDASSTIDLISKNENAVDFIFMDPPYGHEYEKNILEKLSKSTIVDEYTTIIVEASSETNFDYISDLGFEIKKYKKYGSNAHVFIEKADINKKGV